MRLYAAVTGKAAPVVEARYPHVLVSYALDPRLSILDAYTPESLMIDSGAFSVWTKGHTIDVDEYGRWCAGLPKHMRKVGAGDVELRFVNLDVIPGAPGRKPTTWEVVSAANASMANADRLRDVHGLSVMEVYHYGEPSAVLDELLDRRRPGEVLGIGGSVGVPHTERLRWHDAVWAHAYQRARWETDSTHTVIPPLHGLGASNEDLARRYPWWSCDSSTYTIPQRFGRTLNGRGRQEFIETSGGTVLRRAKPAQAIEARRILDRWRRLERDMTNAWTSRGLRFAP